MLSITMPANGAFNLVLTRKGSLTYEFSPLKTSLHLNESNSCGLELEIYFVLFFLSSKQQQKQRSQAHAALK